MKIKIQGFINVAWSDKYEPGAHRVESVFATKPDIFAAASFPHLIEVDAPEHFNDLTRVLLEWEQLEKAHAARSEAIQERVKAIKNELLADIHG